MRQQGTVTYWNSRLRCGWLSTEDGARAGLFPAALMIAGIKSVTAGDVLEFEVEPDEKGDPEAVRLKLLQRTSFRPWVRL